LFVYTVTASCMAKNELHVYVKLINLLH